MIEEAIRKVMELTPGKYVLDAFGRQIWNKNGATLPDPSWPTLGFVSLTALEEYIKEAHPQEILDKDFIHIASPELVVFQGPVTGEKRIVNTYAQAKCDYRPFVFGCWIPTEEFIIGLQTMFVQDETTAKLLKVVGNLSSDTQIKTLDNGVSQEVTARAGITMVDNVELPNPVELRPYRTFLEVVQPKSEYVLRMQKNSYGISCALFDVGGNLWKTEAVKAIKEWLELILAGTDIPVLG